MIDQTLPALVTDIAEARARLTRRRGFEEPGLSQRAKAGIRRVFGNDLTADEVVERVLSDVRNEGDPAIHRYSAAFDGATHAELEVPRATWDHAHAALAPDLREAMEIAAGRIATFHRKQVRT
ncbi:MAG: histidinol dehydrogenase, partial [Thermomicrobiales bacterium]